MGMYADPYGKFGQLSIEMWRACRLVIDTGTARVRLVARSGDPLSRRQRRHRRKRRHRRDGPVHSQSGTSARLQDRRAQDQRRYARRRRQRSASRFDIRRFHNALLDDGAMPLTLLEARIDEWIETEKAKNNRRTLRVAVWRVSGVVLTRRDSTRCDPHARTAARGHHNARPEMSPVASSPAHLSRVLPSARPTSLRRVPARPEGSLSALWRRRPSLQEDVQAGAFNSPACTRLTDVMVVQYRCAVEGLESLDCARRVWRG